VDALAHGLPFALTQGICGGMNLSVDVGLTDVVHVDERQSLNTASSQSFARPRAHTTNAHHHHVRVK
jgi:hypothetical protein